MTVDEFMKHVAETKPTNRQEALGLLKLQVDALIVCLNRWVELKEGDAA